MDGTTEPLLTVIGNPIAGNPSQFALERAIGALRLDWRVLSFDVPPENIAAALNGFSVTGISGVLIDPSVRQAASAWYAEQIGIEGVAIDCLDRGENGRFTGSERASFGGRGATGVQIGRRQALFWKLCGGLFLGCKIVAGEKSLRQRETRTDRSSTGNSCGG